MLFKFGKFWKSLILLSFTWLLYLLFDFEFTIVTLLCLLLISKLDGDDVLI